MILQRLQHAQLGVPSLVTPPHRTKSRGSAMRVQAASSADMALPEPLAYAKAFATVVTRRATEYMLDCASEISITIAEQPQRMKEFQEEVQTAAERELKSSNQQRLLTSTPSSSSGGSASSSTAVGSRSSSSTPVDLATVVDELRADIAASRALLQQIRLGQQPDSMSSR